MTTEQIDSGNSDKSVSTNDVASLLSDGPWGAYQKLVLLLCAIVIILDGVDILAIGLAAPELLSKWGISKNELAPAIAAGLFGMMIGAMAGGLIGDRIGRRWALIAATFTFGALTVAMTLAGNVFVLGALRFIAGLGLGAAIPNATALVSEVTPARFRALAVSLLLTCVPIGGALAGVIGSAILPDYGWRGLFLIAGLAPAAVGAVLIFLLPESPSLLAQNPARDNELSKVLAKMGRSYNRTMLSAAPNSEASAPRTEKPSILNTTFRRDTIAINGAFFFCLTAVYLCFNWIPTLLSEVGQDIASTSRALSIFNLGGVFGALLGGWLFGRMGSKLLLPAIIVVGLVVTIIIMAAPATLNATNAALGALFLVQGACIVGLQVLLYPLASHIYPTNVRATGVGVAAGLGRFGAVVSANVGAAILSLSGAVSFYGAVFVCLALTGVAVFLVQRQIPRANVTSS